MVQAGDRIVVVICIEDGDAVFHVFSSDEAAQVFCDKDDRIHVISDRVLDFPERHEGAMN